METIYPSFGWLPGPTIVPIKDIYTIQKSGYYKLQLINDRAWFHSLKVFYSFNVFAHSSWELSTWQRLHFRTIWIFCLIFTIAIFCTQKFIHNIIEEFYILL